MKYTEKLGIEAVTDGCVHELKAKLLFIKDEIFSVLKRK